MLLCTLNRCSLAWLKRRLMVVQVDQFGLNDCSFVGELDPSFCGFALDVILQGMFLSILVAF
jgi:hypothetical protein